MQLNSNNSYRTRQENLWRIVFALFLIPTFSCAGQFLEKGGHQMAIDIAPTATITRSSTITYLGRAEGESSTFYMLGLFPVTRPLSIDYALNQAVSKIKGGNSMVNINIWHETHFYFPIGRVSVVKVAGDVVALKAPEPIIEMVPISPPPAKKNPRQGRNRKK